MDVWRHASVTVFHHTVAVQPRYNTVHRGWLDVQQPTGEMNADVPSGLCLAGVSIRQNVDARCILDLTKESGFTMLSK